jgi:hypothetical protein
MFDSINARKPLPASLTAAILMALLEPAKPQPGKDEAMKKMAAAFNKQYPLCEDPKCEACNQRRVMAGEPVPAGEKAAAEPVTGPQEGDSIRSNGSADPAHLALASGLDDAGKALDAAVIALIKATKPGSVAHTYARSAQDALRTVNRLTIRAVHAL